MAENATPSVDRGLTCYDCQRAIDDVVVWLGEIDADGRLFELPFHESCANAPWPLFECRRTRGVAAPNGIQRP